MESVHRNVILDILPAYIAGEVSKESRVLVEEYAKKDPQIARLIRTGKLEPDAVSPKIDVPDDLEKKTIQRVRRTIRRHMLYVAFATACVLMIPLIAMQFTDEVNWNLFDFIVMAILLLSCGITYVLVSRISESIVYRTAVGIAVGAGFLLIWSNLAVGIIGSENNPVNLMYFGVPAVEIIGSIVARFRPRGMSLALLITAAVQALITITVLFIIPGMETSVDLFEIITVNGFFILLFSGSALLFKIAGRRKDAA